jgi:uncharacterized protein YjbJ (UPF0337 family)
MVNIQNSQQHIKGVAQQAIGTVEKKLGHPIQGTVDQIKGKVNVVAAEIKSTIQKSKKI